jgi:MFS family permease
MQMVAQNWLVWEITADERWLGIVNGVNAIPFLLFAIKGGQIADRYSRRLVLLYTQTMMMVLAFVLALLASGWWLPIQVWHIALLAGLSSVVSAFNMPAQQAFISDMIEDSSHLSNAIALSSLRFNLARLVGPMLAGIVLVRVGAAGCFLINAVSFVAVLISLLMMRLPPFVPRPRKQSVREGFTYILQSYRVLTNVCMIASGALFVWSASTLFPVFASRFGVGAKGYSWLTSANGLGAMTCGFLLAAYAERVTIYLRIFLGAVLFGLALIAFSFTQTLWQGMFCLAWSGFGMILCANSSNTAVQSEVPEALRGRVMAVYSLAFQGVMPFGGLFAGYLAKHWGAPETVRGNALLFLVATGILFTWNRNKQKHTS